MEKSKDEMLSYIKTKIDFKTSECMQADWEYRQFMSDYISKNIDRHLQSNELIHMNMFVPKCDLTATHMQLIIAWCQVVTFEKAIMLSDILHLLEMKENEIDALNNCPECWSKLERESWQEPSHPETWQWDINPFHYCSSEDCEWSSYEDVEWEWPNNSLYVVQDDLIFWNWTQDKGLWQKKNEPVDHQSYDCIKYLFDLFKKIYE